MNNWEKVDQRFFVDKQKCNPTVRNERKAICETCPSFNGQNITCGECQGAPSVMVWVADASCPIGNW